MAIEVNQTMELTQAVQTLRWLDEERRRDKATIAALQERAQNQEQQLAQQAAQIQDLQASLASIQGLISQAAEFEQIVSNYKNEMVFLLDRREEAWNKEQTEAERLRQIESKAVADHLGRLDKDRQTLSRLDQHLKAQQAEGQRLNEALQRLEGTVADVSKRSDDRIQAVAYLEEQRRADNRRISDLEHYTTELHKRIEALTTKLTLLEDTLQKHRSRIEEAVQGTKEWGKQIEELRVADFEREQKMKRYLDQGEQAAQDLERIRTQTQGFLEQQQLAKRALERLENFQARLEKRQNEVAQMQRVAEDRLRRQWEEWQTEQDKQQKKQDVITEERWRQQERTNTAHLERLDALRAATEMYRAQLDTLWEARRADLARALGAIQDDYKTHTSQIDEQLSILHGEG